MERFPSFPAVNLSTVYAHVKYLSIVYTTFTVLFPPYSSWHRYLFTRIVKRICSGKTTPSLPGTSTTLRLHRRYVYRVRFMQMASSGYRRTRPRYLFKLQKTQSCWILHICIRTYTKVCSTPLHEDLRF